MAAKNSSKPPVKWLMDLHGLVDALSGGGNAVAAVTDAIESGEMKVIRSAGSELQAAYPELWDDFTDIGGRKYEKPTKADHELASHLQQMYDKPILGGIPTYEHFLAIAMCARLKCRLVTSGKAHKRSLDIAKKTTGSVNVVATIADV